MDLKEVETAIEKGVSFEANPNRAIGIALQEVETAIEKGVSFEANPNRAIGIALRLGCAAVAALADIAATLREIKAVFEEEANR